MPRDYFPRRNIDAVHFAANFLAKVAPRPSHFGLTPELVAECAAFQDVFAMCQRLASDPSTATSPARTARDDARVLLEDKLRQLVGIVRAYPGTNATMLKDLGLEKHHRGRGPRSPRPSDAPLVFIDKVIATTVHLRLMDATAGKRRKPKGVGSATIFGFVGAWPPADIKAWQFMARTTRTLEQVTFRNAGPVGGKLWLMARWENTRCVPGPVCAPVMTRVQDGVVLSASMMRQAA